MENIDDIRFEPEEVRVKVNIIESVEDRESIGSGGFTKKVVDAFRSLSKTRRPSQNRETRSEEEGSMNENTDRGRRRYRTYSEKEKRV